MFLGVNKSFLENMYTNSLKLLNGYVDKIVNSKDSLVTERVDPLIELDNASSDFQNRMSLYKNFCTDSEIRQLSTELDNKFTKEYIEKTFDRRLLDKLQEYKDSDNLQKDVSNSYKRSLYDRFINKTLEEFRRNGLHRSDEEIQEIKKIDVEISELSSKFSRNIVEDKTELRFKRSELSGLPESWFTTDRLIDKKEDINDDTFLVTMKYPDVIPIMDFCSERDTRRAVVTAFNKRCNDVNLPVLKRLVFLRDKKAKMLGYKTHADYKTENKVVKTGDNALSFLNTINDLFDTDYDKDLKTLTEYAKSKGFNEDVLQPWDRGFYFRMYKEEHGKLNPEELRRKFPLDKVVSGMFDIYQHLFGFRFVKMDEKDVFHESVEVYDVYDGDTKMGRFYLDLYSREGKYSHAAVFCYKKPHINTETGEVTLPQGMMACNFSKGNLYFNEVETLFHEFGHMMHLLSCRPETCQFSRFSSFDCEWDFVEVPSQMLEFWCFQKEPLLLMSNGLTDDDIESIKKSKHILPSLHYKRQLFFAMFDMSVYSTNFTSEDSIDLQKMWNDTNRKVLKYEPTDVDFRLGSFGHIASGYDAGYYGYLRSETYSANLFYKLFKDQEMNAKIGTEFRKTFLGSGSVKDAVDLMKDTLKEDPDDSYFVQSLKE